MSPHLMLMRYDARKLSTITAFAYWLVAGPFGGHRAYLKDAAWPLMFMAHFITIGLVFGASDIRWQANPLRKFAPSAVVLAWWIVDLFRLPDLVTAGNLALADRLERERIDAEKAATSAV